MTDQLVLEASESFPWLYVVVLSIVIVLGIFYQKFILKPKNTLKRYTQQFSHNNWNTLLLAFTPLDTFMRPLTQNSFKQHKDCHYEYKKVWSQYDVVLCNFVDRPYIQLVNPQLAKQFYEQENEKTFQKYTVLTSQLERMVGKSITFSEGHLWKQKRKIMVQFLNFSFIKSVGSKIEAICKREVAAFLENNKLQVQTKNGKPVSEIHIQELLQMINSTVIAEIFFGGGNQKVDSLKIDGKTLPHFMRGLMDELYHQTINPVSIMLGVKFVELGLREMDRRCNKKLKAFRQFVTNFVHNRLYEIEEEISKKGEIDEPKDLIEAFYLEIGQESVKQKKKQFVDNLINDFANLYTAGTDTTEHATMMLTYFIHKHPDVKVKLLAEFQVHKVNPEELTYDSIKNLSYLEATCYETIRMYQTANGIFPREVLTPVTIGGVTLEKGTVVTAQTFPVHYSQKLYEKPEEFRPERWLDKDGKVKAAQPFCFNSFSHGIRSCIGKQLALQEIKMFTVYFCSKFECQFQTLDLSLNMCGFAYEPQPIKMKFWEK